jgi:phenylacetate-CoA ligase
MTLVAKIRARRYAAEVEERARAYRAPPDVAGRNAVQLDLLNATWARSLATVPYFRELRARENLPERFASLEEFAASVPPMTRRTLQESRAALTSTERRPDTTRITGGSTAAPVQLPAWNSEFVAARPDAWVARSWYGVPPASRLFHLWGHSHLLGTGVPGWMRARRRELYDRLLGYLRFSAYDLRPEAMERAVAALVDFRPDYVIGYSVALDRLARAAEAVREATRAAGVRVVIGTAECFPSADSPERLADAFDCPVAMEYGAVETGIVAHTHPEGGYRVFWRSFLIEGDGAPGSVAPLRITSLSPRSLPLIRYEIGDEIELMPDAPQPAIGLTRFARLAGRCNDYVEMADGMLVHSEAISHAVRPCAGVRGYQVRQSCADIRLVYAADAALDAGEDAGIRERLGKIHPDLASIPFERVDALEQTVAGKTRMIVRESSG